MASMPNADLALDHKRNLVPNHVAIIMDGNGRWAKARGQMRTAGHKAGVDALRNAVRSAGNLGIENLTVFAFSSENWNRPKAEVSELLLLLKRFVRRDLAELHKNNVRVRCIGERESLAKNLRDLLVEAETLTRDNTAMTLFIAFNYGARDEITRAVRSIAQKVESGAMKASEITDDLVTAHLDTAGVPDPDLIIRTSGEQRLSNFMLWQAAYTEFVFLDCHWPDFDAQKFDHALDIYYARDRRFGALKKEATS